MVEKQQARRLIFERRRKMTKESYLEASSLILKRFFESSFYENSDQILTYVSFGKEVSTKELIQRALEDKKQVLVPKVIGKEMIFVKIDSPGELVPGTMGILEPLKNDETPPSASSCMIMPGLAFDQRRHRIGYGGGFYDKYLEKHPDILTIALAFEYQILDQVKTEATDISPKLIITERRLLS